MRTINALTNNKFLNIKEVCHPEKNVKGYQFAERRGVDSIAFICWDRATGDYLVNREYKPPVDEFICSAFGGSLDKNVDQMKIVIGEVREEAGFEVTDKDVIFVGKAFVSTQMNQYCWLYFVMVDKKSQLELKPENAVEAMAKPVWMWRSEIIKLDDWKAVTILTKAENMGIIGYGQSS